MEQHPLQITKATQFNALDLITSPRAKPHLFFRLNFDPQRTQKLNNHPAASLLNFPPRTRILTKSSLL